MRLVDYLGLIRRRFALFTAVAGVVAGISLGLSLMADPSYEAAVKLRARPPAPGTLSQSFNTILEDNQVTTDIFTEAELVRSHEVAARVADQLGLRTPAAHLSDIISVAPLRYTMVLEITARAPDPVFAVEIANGFADAYLEARRGDLDDVLDKAADRLTSRLKEVQERLAVIDERIARAPAGSFVAAQAASERDLALADLVVIRTQLRDLSDRSALGAGFGDVIAPATGARPVRDASPARSLVFGVLLGGPIALAVVLLLDSLSEAVRSKEDAEELTGADVIGLVPTDSGAAVAAARKGANGTGGRGLPGLVGLLGVRRNGSGRSGNGATDTPRLTVDADPFSPVAEAFRTAALNLAAVSEAEGAHTVLFASPFAGDGKTTTAASIAVCAADRGQSVVLVSADLRRPDLHEFVDAEATPGLVEMLEGTPARNVLQQVRPNLAFVGSGEEPPRPDQVLAGANLRKALRTLSTGGVASRAKPSHTVIVDSAPILQAAETLALARAVDGVVLVVRTGVTRRQSLTRTVDQLHRAGGRILGVVLVGVDEDVQYGLNRGSARRLSVVTNGYPNGSGNGHANGHANGYSSARGNGRANGRSNGVHNGRGNGTTPAREASE